jgi:hypothetical protein
MSSVSIAEICSEERALIWAVESDATSSVVHAATAAVESDLIWVTLSEEMVVVMCGALTLDQMPKTNPGMASAVWRTLRGNQFSPLHPPWNGELQPAFHAGHIRSCREADLCEAEALLQLQINMIEYPFFGATCRHYAARANRVRIANLTGATQRHRQDVKMTAEKGR